MLVFSSRLWYPYKVAAVAELADAHDSKSCGKPCGFESRRRHFFSKACKLRICLILQAFSGSKPPPVSHIGQMCSVNCYQKVRRIFASETQKTGSAMAD